MKNKKGFTLVELLAVIVVLAIILVIAVPNVINTINKSRENAKFAAAKEIAAMAEAYFAEHDNKKSVTVSKLIKEGYLEEDATNPRTGENGGMKTGEDDQFITITRNNIEIEQSNKSLKKYSGATYGYSFDDYIISIASDQNGNTPLEEANAVVLNYDNHFYKVGSDENKASPSIDDEMDLQSKKEIIAYKIAFFIKEFDKLEYNILESFKSNKSGNSCYDLNQEVDGYTIIDYITDFDYLNNDEISIYNDNIKTNASVYFPGNKYKISGNQWDQNGNSYNYDAFRFKIDETKGNEDQLIYVYSYGGSLEKSYCD